VGASVDPTIRGGEKGLRVTDRVRRKRVVRGRHAWPLALLLGIVADQGLCAPPAAVKPLIDLPHSYYYREIYLPQLTSGPSAVAWSADSSELVYSMAGSLWRQRIDSTSAQQLTAGPGYDYQPDWSPDGRFVVYTSSAGEAMELWLLDLQSGHTQQLTHGGAVNVEPRWSPDGRRILYVSTAYNRHFHIFVADVRKGELANVVRLTGEDKSPLPRYYYSAYDHEINPTWTRDGRAVVFVSNRGRIHGTGGIWRMAAVPGAQATELRYEETTWRARPDFSPDGQRIVYSSYLGRNWLQLWLMPASGGEPFPVSYGDWDETGPRWSPDGRLIASISNRDGDTQLRLLRIPGGDSRELKITERRRPRPSGTVHVTVRDEQGRLTAARVVITDAAGRFYAPIHAWMHHAEFDRNEHPFEARYFHTAGEDLIEVPAGMVKVEVMKGLGRKPERRTLQVPAAGAAEFAAVLPARAWLDGKDRHWVSADVHVHMNYGGHYRNTPAHLVLQAQAEDLDIVENLIVNKEQRIPDIAYSGTGVDPASTADTLIVHGQEFHTSYWGHLGLLGIRGHILLPGYAGYPNTAAASLYPTNADVADMAHAQGAVVGYVHPFEEEPLPLTKAAHTDADELPVDVALGKVDYLEIVAFADHQATAGVWYRLLNLGFRLPAAGGTDAMADYATLRGPVGLNRVYVSVPNGALDSDAWLEALRQGRTFATNGPLLDFSLDGAPIGATVNLEQPRHVHFAARVRSIVPLDHAQIVCNGQVARELDLGSAHDAVEVAGEIGLQSSGWCLLRASTAHAQYPILDNFVYATTSPVYVSVRSGKPHSRPDARYFEAWIDHLVQVTGNYPDWNSEDEKAGVLRRLQDARRVYESLE
jgi:TolB protein